VRLMVTGWDSPDHLRALPRTAAAAGLHLDFPDRPAETVELIS
jgi:hypothetical protein